MALCALLDIDWTTCERIGRACIGLAVTPSAAAGRPARLREARIDSAAAKNDAAIAVNDKLSLGLRSGAAVTTVARPERTA